ncbi:MAG TPA: tetratricopeptide repeat protein, partial [Anaerolineae bacterium]
ARLVSLTGPGGSGKTRLAVQVGSDLVLDYTDGVWMVELATLTDPLLLPQKLASSLGLRQEPSRSLQETLLAYLRSRTLLLILDNCEHMVDAIAQWVDLLLRNCPNLRVLTTTREALGIAGETTFGVPPLSLPDVRHLPSLEKLAHYDAVRLFVDRASHGSPDFQLTEANMPAVAQICTRLDGIPLALELAAARVKALSVEQIAARLNDRFRLLTGGSRTALPRQQTLRALIDWSYDLLTEPEQKVLRRLSVFAGGWTLEAAEVVCVCNEQTSIDVMDLSTRLIDKSLVVAERREDETRYRMLETIREYGHDRLVNAGEAEVLRACHLDYYVSFAERAALKLNDGDKNLWSHRLDAEYDNLRAALEWSWESQKVQVALRLTVALWRFWELRSYFSDSRVWLEKAVASNAEAPAPIRAQSLHGLGRLDRFQGRYAEGTAHLEECLALYRDLGNKLEIADVFQTLGEVAAEQGDLIAAGRRFEEALTICLALGDQPRLAGIYLSQGEVARVQGNYDSAARLYTQSLTLLEALGDDRRRAIALYDLGQVALHQDDCPRAVQLFLESIRIGRKIVNRWIIAHGLAALVGAACWSEQPGRAVKLSGAAEALFKSIGASMDLADRIEYERSLEGLHAQMDAQTFDAARADGKAMTMEEAVAFALSEAEDV